MFKILILLVLSASSDLFAEIQLTHLAGSYSMACTQTQANTKQAATLEKYTFTKSGNYKFERLWFKAMDCTGKIFDTNTEAGKIQISKENTNNGFNPEGTYEVKYINDKGTDFGLLWLSSDNSRLKVARGLNNSTQNTMLGLFKYIRN